MGGEWEPIKILMQELAYVPSSNPEAKTLQENDEHTNQQYRNDPLKVINAAEKEWDQLDTRLARYDQNFLDTSRMPPQLRQDLQSHRQINIQRYEDSLTHRL
jgi:hypothetical protein